MIVFETDGAANTAPLSAYQSSPTVSESLPAPPDYSHSVTATFGVPTNSFVVDQPCGSAVQLAQSLRPPPGQPLDGIRIFTIGYALKAYEGLGCKQAGVAHTQCSAHDSKGRAPRPTPSSTATGTRPRSLTTRGMQMTAATALQQMATSPTDAYVPGDQNALTSVFAQIATRLNGRLVPDDWAN